VKLGYEIVSTSGTANLLKSSGIKLKTIEEITKAPEVLGGRVKTLQHLIFAGILADKSNSSHIAEVEKFGFELFDLVAVSLYPFSETISKDNCSVDEAIEQIDIGGVSLIRAAAKNYSSVSVIVNPGQYNNYLDALKNNKNINLQLASEAFSYIAWYDVEISNYFKKLAGENSGRFLIDYKNVHSLRYGENPHMKAELYDIGSPSFSERFEKLHGKELSYINILDIDADYHLIKEFDEPTCVIVKHTNPCGAASAENIFEAYKKAFACDTVSPFGGIVIVNRELDLKTAMEMDKIFTEIIIAPSFTKDAFDFLLKKKNRRLIKYHDVELKNEKELKSVTGGLLVQDKDSIVWNDSELKVVTERAPTDEEMKDLLFAMKICKHTKSNAVIYAKGSQTYGIGGGQPSRVDSSILAVTKSKRFGFDLTGCSVASDAFFPFPDGVIEAAKAGAKAVIQPGGSVNDGEVIKAANEYNLAMVFTGIRHFKH
jgi:phosphoribosylaminoimidazolecarboxamide formyltransferase / IMP cyclohydrolase